MTSWFSLQGLLHCIGVFFSAFEVGSFAGVAGCPEDMVPWYD